MTTSGRAKHLQRHCERLGRRKASWPVRITSTTHHCLLSSCRYEHARVEVWLSRDPIAERGGRNLNAFLYNNPISFGDGNGHIPIAIKIGAGGGIVIVGLCTWAFACHNHMNNIREATNRRIDEIMNDLIPNYDPDRQGPDVEGTIADALRHCIGACTASQNPGICGSRGFVRRKIQEREDERPGIGSDMDRANNTVGFNVSGDCAQGCLVALGAGMLNCIAGGQLTPCKL